MPQGKYRSVRRRTAATSSGKGVKGAIEDGESSTVSVHF